jgi:hypothetical protein
VPGDDYTLWFYVPAGVNVAEVRAQTKTKLVVAAQHEQAGKALKVTFQGQAEPVDWEVAFKTSADN